VTDEKTPWRYRALGRGFAIADALAPAALLPRLEAETLIAAAGVTPSAEAREGLQQLMAALAKDSELTLFGRLSVRWDMIRLLRNAAAVEAAHECNPALAAAGIETPIFILGLPRSGTTFLHALLAGHLPGAAPARVQPRRRPPRSHRKPPV
jgi:hypothetical protein